MQISILMAMLLLPTAEIAVENKSHLSQKHVLVCVYITNFPVQPQKTIANKACLHFFLLYSIV